MKYLRLRDLGIVSYGYRRFKPSLPPRLRREIENLLQINRPKGNQLEEIENLGSKIGLEQSEIYAATGLPIDNINSMSRNRITLLGLVIGIFAVTCISFAIIVILNGGHLVNPTPTYTYTPGSRYGSISPEDFISG